MSKAVMISIQPKWCEPIANGKKTIEVRKTKPKLETPFKCYIYCTQAKNKASVDGYTFFADELYIDHCSKTLTCGHTQFEEIVNGKVIGEFVCDRVTFLGNIATDSWEYLSGSTHEAHKRLVAYNACMTESECIAYGGQYGWHISDLVLYDKPKELSEFYKPCIYGNDDEYCWCFECDKSGYTPDMHIDCFNVLTRPPQSWCYVEDLGGNRR